MSYAVNIIFHHKKILINSKLIIFNFIFFRGFGKQVSVIRAPGHVHLQRQMKHITFY